MWLFCTPAEDLVVSQCIQAKLHKAQSAPSTWMLLNHLLVYLPCCPLPHAIYSSVHPASCLPLLCTYPALFFFELAMLFWCLVLTFAPPSLAGYPLSMLGDLPPTLQVPSISSWVRPFGHPPCPLTPGMVAIASYVPPWVLVIVILSIL